MSPKKSITPAAPRPPQPPSKPKGLGRRTRPGAITKEPIRKFGPRWLKLYALPIGKPDWCVPWRDFVGAHTSLSEQMIYAAISMILHDPPNFTEPPYTGGVNWTYQDPLLGGRLSKGGQVCDFTVKWGTDDVCIRLQSEHYHIFAEMSKRADELYEKTHSQLRIQDIYEPEFVGDCTLRAACAVVANALAGRESPNPAYLGTAQPTRRRGGTR